MENEKKDKFIIIRVSTKLRNDILLIAKNKGSTISDFVRDILTIVLNEKN